MDEYPLMTDLAVILISAGVMSVICRAIKLPILLGYLFAGVLMGPHVPLIPRVHDMASINTWSEIGVIFLLFALGLEFNFKNLFKVGKTGLVTVLSIATAMMLSCFGIGQLMGWQPVTSIFIGGMLSISSTMVIVKAFEELKLKGQPFTHVVYGVMVFQDILGIILMVILPMIAASSGSIFESVSTTAMRVTFFLVLWFVGGIFLVPTLLRKLKKYLSDEILLIISLALCFGMVMLASTAQLSTALGAFTIGSILGATGEAHHIESLVTPLKNLFGAIFFVSIGMLVDPGAIIDNIGILLILLPLLLLLNPIMGTLAAFFTGKSLRNALRAGACYGQIGEFSFILATLGVKQGVLTGGTYPVIIMISAITMVTTPSMLKLSARLVDPIGRLLPENKQYRIDEEPQKLKKSPNRRIVLLKHFALETFILSMLLIGIISFFDGFVEPMLRTFIQSQWEQTSHVLTQSYFDPTTLSYAQLISEGLCTAITLLCIMPFLSALILRRHKLNRAFTVLLVRGTGEGMFRTLQLVRIVVAAIFIAFALITHSPFFYGINFAIGAVVLFIVCYFNIIFSNYMRLEQQFLLNYNEADDDEEDRMDDRMDSIGSMASITAGSWLSASFSVARYTIDEDSTFLDKTLIELDLRALHGLRIIRIERGDHDVINIPPGKEKLQIGDTVYIAGYESDLRQLRSEPYNISDKKLHIQSMRQFSQEVKERNDETGLRCIQISIQKDSGFANKTLRTSGISGRNKCLVIGIETNGRVEMDLKPDDVFEPGCRLWVVGEADNLSNVLADNIQAELPETAESPAAA